MEDVTTIHNKLLTEIIIGYLDDTVDNGVACKTFRLNAKIYLKTPRLKTKKEPTEIMDALEAKGLLKPGKYDVLRELVGNIHEEILQMIEGAEAAIEKKMEIKNVKRITRSSSKTEKESVEGHQGESVAMVHTRAQSRGVKRTLSSQSNESEDDNYRKKNSIKSKPDVPIAEKFRKPQDTNLKSRELHSFYTRDWHKSVAYIDLEQFGSGTGFRVGSQYLMSVYHVWEQKIESLWKIVRDVMLGEILSNWLSLLQAFQVEITLSGNESPKEGIKKIIASWRQQNSPVNDFTGFLDHLGSLFRTSADEIRKVLSSQCTDKYLVHFGKLKDSDGHKFSVEYDIPFYDKENDIIILKLSAISSMPFPASFSLLDDKSNLSQEMHIVGHPTNHGKSQIFDPRCRVLLKQDDLQQAMEDVQKAKEFWGQLGLPADAVKDYDSLTYETETLLHFHCSLSTAHGASGSPGIIQLDSKRPVVQAMLQAGIPWTFYNCGGKLLPMIHENKIPMNYLFERGISMPSVDQLLINANLHYLRNDIFS